MVAIASVTDTTRTTQYPNSYYPGAQDNSTDAGAQTNQTSPPKYPSPWMDGSGGWDAAYAKAQAFVKQLTLLEKVNLTTGVGSVFSPLFQTASSF